MAAIPVAQLLFLGGRTGCQTPDALATTNSQPGEVSGRIRGLERERRVSLAGGARFRDGGAPVRDDLQRGEEPGQRYGQVSPDEDDTVSMVRFFPSRGVCLWLCRVCVWRLDFRVVVCAMDLYDLTVRHRECDTTCRCSHSPSILDPT